MITVQEAKDKILTSFSELPAEDISLDMAVGRVLAKALVARRTQPPRDLSSMDGYAVRCQDFSKLPRDLRCIGEAPAGTMFEGTVGPGETVRIFTGGPIPVSYTHLTLPTKA